MQPEQHTGRASCIPIHLPHALSGETPMHNALSTKINDFTFLTEVKFIPSKGKHYDALNCSTMASN
jgi:hypothetical protein